MPTGGRWTLFSLRQADATSFVGTKTATPVPCSFRGLGAFLLLSYPCYLTLLPIVPLWLHSTTTFLRTWWKSSWFLQPPPHCPATCLTQPSSHHLPVCSAHALVLSFGFLHPTTGQLYRHHHATPALRTRHGFDLPARHRSAGLGNLPPPHHLPPWVHENRGCKGRMCLCSYATCRTPRLGKQLRFPTPCSLNGQAGWGQAGRTWEEPPGHKRAGGHTLARTTTPPLHLPHHPHGRTCTPTPEAGRHALPCCCHIHPTHTSATRLSSPRRLYHRYTALSFARADCAATA